MPRSKDKQPAVRVYTVCDESRYLIVRNVPALGCGDDLLRLFSTYGDVEECKPMDAEDCEQFTDVYWIKFRLVSNARFAKRKLDEYVFFGNQLQVSYSPEYESLLDTKEKLEGRRKEVLARLNPGKFKGCNGHPGALVVANPSEMNQDHKWDDIKRDHGDPVPALNKNISPMTRVSSGEDYFTSQSMNQTVRLVREKLDKIESSGNHPQGEPKTKRPRMDNRRRI